MLLLSFTVFYYSINVLAFKWPSNATLKRVVVFLVVYSWTKALLVHLSKTTTRLPTQRRCFIINNRDSLKFSNTKNWRKVEVDNKISQKVGGHQLVRTVFSKRLLVQAMAGALIRRDLKSCISIHRRIVDVQANPVTTGGGASLVTLLP